jgi:hypothetical protein
MLWRLNFVVILLMLTMNNTYILYYICPLHTFFFLMVRAPGPSTDRDRTGISRRTWPRRAAALVRP